MVETLGHLKYKQKVFEEVAFEELKKFATISQKWLERRTLTNKGDGFFAFRMEGLGLLHLVVVVTFDFSVLDNLQFGLFWTFRKLGGFILHFLNNLE